MNKPNYQARRRTLRRRRVRAALFAATVLVVLGLSGFLLKQAFIRPAQAALAGTVIEVSGSMSGFEPKEIRVKLGQPVTIRLTSLDSPLHSGGGKHQWAVDELRVNILAAARESSYATFTPSKPGEFTFYCDVCCGGRSSPSMQGKLIVES